MTNFKLAQLSDIHAQYRSTQYVNAQKISVREIDGYQALATCVNDIIKEECDAAVVCGDIFHGPEPSVRAIVFVQNQLRKLSDRGIPVYILAGNHDVSDTRESLAATKVLDDASRGIYSTAEPYVVYEITNGIHLHMISHVMYSLQSDLMKTVVPLPGEVNIFATHGSVIDPLLKMKLHTEASPREIVIPDGMLMDADWSYRLLGHIHERGWVGSKDGVTDTSKTKTYYNGSLIRRGFSDKETPLGRGWTLWEIDSEGNFQATPKKVKQRPQIDFPVLDAAGMTAAELTDQVVKNLQLSQANGPDFDIRSAPILRQRIVNIPTAKYNAMDLKTIQENRRHALFWEIKKILVSDDSQSANGNSVEGGDGLQGGDVVKMYDDWIDNSTKLQEADQVIREKVKEQARDYIEQSRDASLEDE